MHPRAEVLRPPRPHDGPQAGRIHECDARAIAHQTATRSGHMTSPGHAPTATRNNSKNNPDRTRPRPARAKHQNQHRPPTELPQAPKTDRPPALKKPVMEKLTRTTAQKQTDPRGHTAGAAHARSPHACPQWTACPTPRGSLPPTGALKAPTRPGPATGPGAPVSRPRASQPGLDPQNGPGPPAQAPGPNLDPRPGPTTPATRAPERAQATDEPPGP